MKIRGNRGRASHNLLVIPTLAAYDLTTLKYSTTGPGKPARETVEITKVAQGMIRIYQYKVKHKLCCITYIGIKSNIVM